MPAPTTPGQRFTQLIQQLGLTKNAFAQSLGKTATVVQHIVDERNKPGFDLLNKVCEVYPNVASDWLMLGRGPMLRTDNPEPLFAEAPTASAEAAPAATGPARAFGSIDPDDIPPAPRRRASTLLQPADIAATLVLAAQGTTKNGYAPAPAAEPVPPAAAAPAAPAPAFTGPPAAPPAAAASVAAPAATPSATPLPDPAYLAAALQAQHLQHQLALAEQRTQHLLEQQALLKQLVEVLQDRRVNG